MWGHLSGPFGTKCGWEQTHQWIDSCEFALGQGALVGLAIAILLGVFLHMACRKD